MTNKILKSLVVTLSLSGFSTIAFGQYSQVKEKATLESLKETQLLLKPALQSNLLEYLKPKYSYLPTLGPFCLLEDNIAKKATFPVKMRLGSVDYVDKLENKRN